MKSTVSYGDHHIPPVCALLREDTISDLRYHDQVRLEPRRGNLLFYHQNGIQQNGFVT